MARSRFSTHWIAVGLALSTLAAALCLTGAADRLDNIVYDLTLQVSGRATPRNILIVAIDDRSLAALGPWPWSRRLHADLLRRLGPQQPLAIVYDVLFVAPGKDAAQDADLAGAMRAAGRVYLPMLLTIPGMNGRGADPLPPAPVVGRAAAGIGHVRVDPDGDGVVRRIDLALDGDQRWRHLIAVAAQTVAGRAGSPAPSGRRAATQPVRRGETVMIAYGGPPGHIRRASFVDLLRGEVPAEFVRGAYVLVGATAPGLGDQYSTPVSQGREIMPGIEIQANLLDTLLTGRGVREAPVIARIAIALAAIWVLLLGFIRLRPVAAAWHWLGMMVITMVLSAGLLGLAHIWLPPGATLLVLIVAQPLWAWRRLSAVSTYMLEELSRLAKEPGLLSGPSVHRLGDDRIKTQIDLMEDTVAQVRALRRLVSTAIQNHPDATVLVDQAGDIVLANTEAIRLFKPRGGLRARHIECFFSLSGASPSGDALSAFGPAAFEDPAHPWSVERTGADGSVREIRHVAWLDDARPVGWVVRFSDITALRLAQRRREETLQLLTHDMRAPQASILAMLAQQGPAGQAGGAAGRLAERIAHYARRTIALADGFLHLARADAGGYDLGPVDMANVLVEAVDDLWPQSSGRSISIMTTGVDEEHMVSGDQALLTRALVNLIGNAIKFSDTGGRIDCMVASEPSIGGGASVVCTVTDHGVGMSPETRTRLFGRFRYRPAEDGRKIDGVGLGLTFVQSVALGHGGHVGCASAVGEGSTFTLTLPALFQRRE